MTDPIDRQAAIDAVYSETVSTNPEHFKSSEKFIKFMDDADIASFGKWQWANGFNTALVAAKIRLEQLPSAEPTLYGYKIEHLAYIARVMQKEGITAEDAARTFDDLGRAVSWTIDEVRQKMEEVIYDHNTGKI